ncbi:MAG: DsbA family protein [Candidatus Woesearchaeota archaeon]
MNRLYLALTGGLTLLAAACIPSQRIPLVNGQQPHLEYFFSPSCDHCKNGTKIVDELEARFPGQVNVERLCVVTNPKDYDTCVLTYRQDPLGNTLLLNTRGVSEVPSFFINGKLVPRSSAGICNELGMDTDCLK